MGVLNFQVQLLFLLCFKKTKRWFVDQSMSASPPAAPTTGTGTAAPIAPVPSPVITPTITHRLLALEVIEARNLAPRSRGTADPMVVLTEICPPVPTRNGQTVLPPVQRYKTKHRRKTLVSTNVFKLPYL